MKEKLHTADHILFTILDKKFKVKTKAMEFKEDSCRVDYECEQDLRPLKEELEQEVNKIVSESHEVISYKLSRDKAKEITDVSLVPESIKEINIYEIVGFNKIACAGPHAKNTQEIGNFKIIKIEKKGKNCFSIKYTVD
jgi:Ser-tRNA(Ala) deacylase AlaX